MQSESRAKEFLIVLANRPQHISTYFLQFALININGRSDAT